MGDGRLWSGGIFSVLASSHTLTTHIAQPPESYLHLHHHHLHLHLTCPCGFQTHWSDQTDPRFSILIWIGPDAVCLHSCHFWTGGRPGSVCRSVLGSISPESPPSQWESFGPLETAGAVCNRCFSAFKMEAPFYWINFFIMNCENVFTCLFLSSFYIFNHFGLQLCKKGAM